MTTKGKEVKSEFLSRNEIFKTVDLKTKEIFIPEWGGKVCVRSLTGAERDRFEAETMEKRGDGYQANFENLRARLIALSVVDEDGKHLFMAGDVKKLGEKNSAALNRIFEVSRRLSGLTGQDVEDLAKN